MFFTDSCFARANIDIREFPKLASNLLANLRLEKQTLELSAKQGFPRHIPHSPQHLIRLSWMNHIKPLSLSACHFFKKISQQTQNINLYILYIQIMETYRLMVAVIQDGWRKESLDARCSCASSIEAADLYFLLWHWLMICHCHCHSWVRHFTFHFLGIPASSYHVSKFWHIVDSPWGWCMMNTRDSSCNSSETS